MIFLHLFACNRFPGVSENCDKNIQENICTKSDPLLMNQCIVINPNYEFHQTDSVEVMNRELLLKDPDDDTIDEKKLLKQFPVYVWISPVETTWKWGQGTYFTKIGKPGE